MIYLYMLVASRLEAVVAFEAVGVDEGLRRSVADAETFQLGGGGGVDAFKVGAVHVSFDCADDCNFALQVAALLGGLAPAMS